MRRSESVPYFSPFTAQLEHFCNVIRGQEEPGPESPRHREVDLDDRDRLADRSFRQRACVALVVDRNLDLDRLVAVCRRRAGQTKRIAGFWVTSL